MKVLQLITARGGSKGVPDKNLRELGGIPLVGYKAIAARRSRHCDRLLVSTDSREIMEVAMEYGAEAPFLRPDHLASDTASSMDVIAHAIDYLEREEGERYDAVVLLEPSSPFGRPADLDLAVELLQRHDAQLVVSLVRHKIHPIHIGPMDRDGRFAEVVERLAELESTNRQDLPAQFTMNGCAYAFTWNGFKAHGTIYHTPERSFGFEMPASYSVEIDEEVDLDWASFLLDSGNVDISHWT